MRRGSPCKRKHAMLGPSASWRWRPVNLSLENDSKSPCGEGGVYLGNSDRDRQTVEGHSWPAFHMWASRKVGSGFQIALLNTPFTNPAGTQGTPGELAIVLGPVGGCPSYRGRRESCSQQATSRLTHHLPVQTTWVQGWDSGKQRSLSPQGQPDSHQVISLLSRAGPVILPETRLSVVSHRRGRDGAGRSL
ncbi:unnamed protein product [Rangifer tarandus platyrhynchus]|uniref:Uncharacterized protein n=1 Tax=Rangifer tarandus platyrhynchus TaxID=3082113 RepID=A0AC59ZI27_RANTA